jgi:hypothetical protein
MCLQAMGAVRDMWHDSFAAILSPRPKSPPLRTSTEKQVAHDTASCGGLHPAALGLEQCAVIILLPHRLTTQKHGLACGAPVGQRMPLFPCIGQKIRASAAAT